MNNGAQERKIAQTTVYTLRYFIFIMFIRGGRFWTEPFSAEPWEHTEPKPSPPCFYFSFYLIILDAKIYFIINSNSA